MYLKFQRKVERLPPDTSGPPATAEPRRMPAWYVFGQIRREPWTCFKGRTDRTRPSGHQASGTNPRGTLVPVTKEPACGTATDVPALLRPSVVLPGARGVGGCRTPRESSPLRKRATAPHAGNETRTAAGGAGTNPKESGHPAGASTTTI